MADYVKKNPKSLVELDRHGHLSIMSSHRLIGFIRDYIIESCTALLSPVAQTHKQVDEEVVAMVEEELDDSDFIFVDKDDIEDGGLPGTQRGIHSHRMVEESDNEEGYVLIDTTKIEEESSPTGPRF